MNVRTRSGGAPRSPSRSERSELQLIDPHRARLEPEQFRRPRAPGLAQLRLRAMRVGREAVHQEGEAAVALRQRPERIGVLDAVGVDRRRVPAHLVLGANVAEQLPGGQRPGLDRGQRADHDRDQEDGHEGPRVAGGRGVAHRRGIITAARR